MTSDNPDEMLSAWTPGPWFIHDGTVNNDRWYVGRTIGGGPEGTRICDLPPYYKPERTAANARLIAAAPDLAEALRDARSAIASLGEFDLGGVDVPDFYTGEIVGQYGIRDELLSKIDAALSRLNP